MISVFHKQLSTIGRAPSGKLMPQDGLVFYAPLDKDAATAETGQTLIESGTITYETVDGIPCAYFNGSSTIYLPDNSSDIAAMPSGNSPFTMTAWLKSSYDDHSSIIGYAGTYVTGRDIWIEPDGSLHFKDGEKSVAIAADCNAYDNQWHHLLTTYDGSTINLYFDGVLVGTGTNTLNTDTQFFGIGAWRAGGNTYCAEGHIAGCRIYNRVLTDSEITQLYSEFAEKTVYQTSSGFNALGRPIRYRDAISAQIQSGFRKDDLLFYHDFGNGFGDTADSGQV